MKKGVFSVLSSLIPLIILSGCTSISAFFANAPSYFDDVQITKDVIFNEANNLKLDVYTPPPSIAHKNQVIIFFYGGSWESGSKNLYRFVGSVFANHGYVVIIPDYRKYPSVKFPEFMFDVADAVEWTQNNIKKYGVKNPEIILVGHSAGANISTLLITDKSYLQSKKIKVYGGIGLAGAYDFTPNTERLKDIFGPPTNYPSMRPLTFIDGSEPPLFLAHGEKDKIVGLFNFDRMVSKLKEKKVPVTAKLYPDMGHVDLISQLSWIGGKESLLFKDIIKFLNNLRNSSHAER